MRINISLCKYCKRKDDCSVKKDLRGWGKCVPMNLTLNYNCTHYKDTFAIGDIVEIELKTIEIEPTRYVGNEGETSGGEWEWKSEGWAKGQIVRLPSDNKYRYFAVKLDNPVKLVFPKKGDIQNSEEVEVTFYRKISKDIRFISKGEIKEKLAEEVPF